MFLVPCRCRVAVLAAFPTDFHLRSAPPLQASVSKFTLIVGNFVNQYMSMRGPNRALRGE